MYVNEATLELLVEGENDALTAWYHGIPCLGIPGADMAKLLSTEMLVGVDRLDSPDRRPR
jgi:hypothetical protein